MVPFSPIVSEGQMYRPLHIRMVGFRVLEVFKLTLDHFPQLSDPLLCGVFIEQRVRYFQQNFQSESGIGKCQLRTRAADELRYFGRQLGAVFPHVLLVKCIQRIVDAPCFLRRV